MRIMGLDLSVTRTGISCPDGTTQALKPPPLLRGDDRLVYLANRLLLAVRTHRADLVVIEDVPSTMQGAAGKIVPMLHGAVRTDLLRAGVPYMTVSPSTLKKFATGDGSSRSDKTAMALAAYKRLGREYGTPDECDADWLRVAGCVVYGLPESQAVSLPQDQVRALTRTVKGVPVEWPVVGGRGPSRS